MNNIAVSIIIPIYNAEKYLDQCIQSAINQTLCNIEIILINDGSRDGSESICKKFIEKDSRIIYKYKENEGLAAARQDGIDLAKGKYIGFIDSDDWIETDMYEKMYEAALSNNSDVVLCDCFKYDEKKRDMGIKAGPYSVEQIKNELLNKTLIRIDENGSRQNIRWSNCLRIYKKETIDKYNIQFDRRFRRCQDLPFTYDMMLHADNFYYLNEFLYHNRQDAGSLSRGYSNNMWKLIKPVIEHIHNSSKKYANFDSNQIIYSTSFFLIVDCILNEFKKDAPNFILKKKHIKEILNDDVCVNTIENLEGEKLNSYYLNIFYKNMKKQSVNKLLINHYYYHSLFKKKIIGPILNVMTENSLYKKLRDLRRK